MLKAIIFDVDGVLVHSDEANTAFLQALMRKAGYETIESDALRQYLHLPLSQTLANLIGPDNTDEIERVYALAKDRSIRLESNRVLRSPDGLQTVLNELKRRYQLAIVTSRIKMGVDEVFDGTDLLDLFDAIVTYEDYDHPKPHPEPLHVALNRLSLSPDEAIYVGDSPTDIDAACGAGMRSIYLSPREHDLATVRVSAFAEIPAAIDSAAIG